MQFMGTEISGNIRNWGGAERRVGSILAITTATVILVGAVAAYLLAGDIAWLFWTLAGVLALVLAFVVALLALNADGDIAHEDHESHAHHRSETAYPEEAPDLDNQPPAATSHKLTLRCGDCGTVFDVADDGTRPLYHTCPGCGAEGVLREPTPPVAPAPEPEPAQPSREDLPLAAAPAAAPSPLNAPRRLKLRCGGCKEIFVIEDTGERPLRRPCPHCSRMGEIR